MTAYSKDHDVWSLGEETSYVKALDIHHSNPQGNCPHHISVAGCAIHFWRNSSMGTEMVQQVDYNAPQEVSNGHCSLKNVDSNIWRQSPNGALSAQYPIESRW